MDSSLAPIRVFRAGPLLVFFAVLLFAMQSGAWQQSKTSAGVPLEWKSSCVYWSMAEQEIDNRRFEDPAQISIPFEDLYEAVEASFDTWEEVECSYLYFVATAPMHCLDVGYHHGSGNANRILFRSSGWIDPDAPWREEGQIALTSVFYDTESGEIYDVDIEFNSEFFELSTSNDDPRTDIQNALTHELGHLIGLGHSADRSSTMYERADDSEVIKRDLEDDDIEGLCEMYPIGQNPNTCFEPPGGLDLECQHATWCSDEVNGIVEECTFDEIVCCCEEPGGLGACGWEDSSQCRSTSRHAVLQLDPSVACPGEQPDLQYTCCCSLTNDGATCSWQRFSQCEESGIPLQAINSTHLCGSMPNDDGCDCSLAGAPRDLNLGFLSRLFTL